MKFIISRTSLGIDGKTRPCAGAERAEATYLDWRTVKTLEEAKKCFWSKKWFDSTVNYREEEGMIVGERKKKDKVWVIDVVDLQTLLNLFEKEGNLIINSSDYKEFPYEIKIYDDYRE